MEHIRHGTLKNFVDNVKDRYGAPLPKSFQRSIFLCLVKIACALAYPSSDGDNVPSDANINPGALVHWDLAWSNCESNKTESIK